MRNSLSTAVLLSSLVTSCAGPAPTAVESTSGAVVGGSVDSTTKAVVGLGISITNFFMGHCSGTLIAPNLVLTARHCVALTASPGAYGSVVCGKTPFTLQGPGPLFRATVETVRPKVDSAAFYKGTGTVFVDKSANDICGYDIALIMLEGKGIPASVTAPIAPRIDAVAVKDETFSAVGYGLTQPADGGTSGTRMRIDGRKVVCVKKSCTAWVKDTEFGSDAPTCQGDSGGPALDSKGRVFGVLSRGPQGCTSSVYGDVASNKALIVNAAVAAAKQGGYPLPAWAKPHVKPDLGPPDAAIEASAKAEAGSPHDAEVKADSAAPGSSGGCAIHATHATSWPSAALLLFLLMLYRTRKRQDTAGKFRRALIT